jgi:integrase
MPRYLSLEDVKKITDYCKKHEPEMYRVIRFVLLTGCRREEIIRAKYEHIRDTGEILIYGKGNKERLVPLFPEALEEKKDIGKIFRYASGSTISNYFRKIVRAVGVQARFHDLRHTAATYMLANGIDIMTVKDILGHADIRTTEIYATVLAESRMKQIKKLNYGDSL